ncbi:hypothetical protein EDC55_10735 [Allofrancisella inopinata]|uniref:Uncharacterized protein n=1 Tax=Allofrancisella inopinata TaxID=1085647 RepID=A0AAE6YIP2_9GAMM|nr:hypothetical protein [Allofrancisella inopinata]QIV95502.1 hypothetical protein E4K63_01070 [Allofrancisella inopinata]TDT72639.1 hypothetical protein EDC55_10735 [Allofrancisella inopinata]
MKISLYTGQESVISHKEPKIIDMPGITMCYGLVIINGDKEISYFYHVASGKFQPKQNFSDFMKLTDENDLLEIIINYDPNCNSSNDVKETTQEILGSIIKIHGYIRSTIVNCSDLIYNEKGQIMQKGSMLSPNRHASVIETLIERGLYVPNINTIIQNHYQGNPLLKKQPNKTQNHDDHKSVKKPWWKICCD